MFDTQEYAQALDELLLSIEQVPDPEQVETQKALEKICRVLRVGAIKEYFYNNEEEEAAGIEKHLVLYDSGRYDEEVFYSQRAVIRYGKIAILYFYQRKDEDKWSRMEEQKVRVLAKTLFNLYGRMEIMQIVERLTYTNGELDIYNHNYFLKWTNDMIAAGHIGDYVAGYFNLKRFSTLNQRYGREAGTKIMKMFVEQLQEMLGKDGIVCRVVGDNFAMIFPKKYLEEVVSFLDGTWIVCEQERIFVEAYTGYYVIPQDCKNAADISDCIRLAMNIAKNVLRTTHTFYDEEITKSHNQEKLIEDIFPGAIANEEFQVYYQPKVLLKDYRLAGAEALCRWFHDGVMISPNQFIPILEQSKFVCTLDFYMLDHVCRDIRRWMDGGQPVVKISVNFSRRHMEEDDLVERILAVIDRYQVPHEYIEIELTETTTDVDFKELKKLALGLREKGITTSVDDFGIGYSSLNLIKESPWSVLKIDKSFLPSGDKTDSQKYVMLKYLIAMLQDMGLECIAEGVETIEQVKLLKEHNCYLAQGFYFDKPLPVDVFEQRLGDLGK